MAGLGGARLSSPAALAPRDPPVVLPPPVPAPPPAPASPRPGEVGGAAISPPPPATAAGPDAVATPEAPPVTEQEPEKVDAPRPAQDARARGWSLARFAVVYDVDRPHGRIGLAWAAVTVAAVFAGKEALAAWLGLTAFVGASQTAAARRALDERPPPWLAALTALGPPVAAVFGGMQLVGAVLTGLALAFLVRTFTPPASPLRDVSTALLVGVATGTAAGSVVVTRELGMNPAFFLLACAAVYDVGAYLIGTGAGAAWEGPAAGMVGIVPVSILASVLLVPPFPAGGPLLLGFLAVVLVPFGPLLATALVGDRELDAPGLRRLDSLLLLGPMWAWAATRLIG
jgi:CDP-diglyceride synthetase